MQPYRPPHMRQQGQAAPKPSSSSISRPPNPPESNAGPSSRPPPSRRDWSRSTTPNNVLGSPASDMRPMRRQLKVEVDEMDLLQSVSRSGGDGAEGDALKDWATQERYRAYIEERLDKHYARFRRERHRAPPDDARDELESLGSIIILYRKLREGIMASHRIDAFSIPVFEDSARLAILAHNPSHLLSALSALVPGLYSISTGSAASEPDQLGHRLANLEISDNRVEFASLLLLYHLAHSDSRSAFHATLSELTAPHRKALRSPFSNDPPSRDSASPLLLRSDYLGFALRAARALASETFNPLSYYGLLRDTEASAYERIVLSWAQGRVGDRAWDMMKRAYLETGLIWAKHLIGLEGDNWRRFIEARGGTIERERLRTR